MANFTHYSMARRSRMMWHAIGYRLSYCMAYLLYLHGESLRFFFFQKQTICSPVCRRDRLCSIGLVSTGSSKSYHSASNLACYIAAFMLERNRASEKYGLVSSSVNDDICLVNRGGQTRDQKTKSFHICNRYYS